MILGFILWWPLGLAALAFLYWSRKMGFCDFSRDDRWQRKAERWQMKMDRMREKLRPPCRLGRRRRRDAAERQ